MRFLKIGFFLLTLVTVGMIAFLFIPLTLTDPFVLFDTEPTSSIGNDTYFFAFGNNLFTKITQKKGITVLKL